MSGVLSKLRVAGVCAAGLLLALPTAHACMHPPRGYPGKLGSTVQEYLLYRDGDLVRLVANQRVAADRDLPGELAWVIPLPSMPLEYRTEKDSLFPWLFHATETRHRPRDQFPQESHREMERRPAPVGVSRTAARRCGL